MLPTSKIQAFGALAILAGLVIPSTAWLGWLRGPAPGFTPELLAGAVLFRAGLVALGAFGLVLPRWRWGSGELVTPQKPRAAHFIILGMVVAAALAVRLYRLGEGLWLDEILTYTTYARMPFGEIATTYASENQHLLYSLMAHACFELFGESAWALRLPAALFGVASIVAVYLLGREVARPREALLAAALLAFSYHHVWFSQNARGYTGLLFWTAASSWIFLRALRDGRGRQWAWYAIAAALGVYTHITMLFVIAGHFVTYLWELFKRRGGEWPARWTGLAGFIGATLLTFQLYALVLPQVLGGMSRTVSYVEAWKNPLWTLFEFVNGLRLNFAGGVLGIAALAVFAAGLWSYRRNEPRLLLLLFVPPVLGASLVLAVGHHLWPRFFFFAFGFGALVAVRGLVSMEAPLARLLRLSPPRAVWAGSLLGVGLVAVSAVSVRSAFGPKQDYAGALEFVQSTRGPGDAVVSVGLASFPYLTLYKADLKPVESVADLEAVRAHSRRTILLYTLEPVMESMHPDLMSLIRRDFSVVRKFRGTLAGGTVFVCASNRS